LSRVSPGARCAKPLPDRKGAAAESENLQFSLGHSENIRLTVAFAESYGLIVTFFRRNGGWNKEQYKAFAKMQKLCSFFPRLRYELF